jgi:hypothetical protein
MKMAASYGRGTRKNLMLNQTMTLPEAEGRKKIITKRYQTLLGWSTNFHFAYFAIFSVKFT